MEAINPEFNLLARFYELETLNKIDSSNAKFPNISLNKTSRKFLTRSILHIRNLIG